MLFRTLMAKQFLIVFICIHFATDALGRSSESIDRESIRLGYGLALVDTGRAGDWQPEEMQALLSLLATLPKVLGTIAKHTTGREIRLVKNYLKPGAQATHLTPKSLTYQLQLDLQDAQHLAAGIQAQTLTPVEKSQYQLYLQRKLIHHLLHLYDTEFQVSSSHEWRRMSGWRYREYFGIQIPLIKEALNQDPRNYTRDEGMLSPEEDFASFGEFFFADSWSDPAQSIKCRIPDKYQYFSSRFPAFQAFAERANIVCESPDAGFLSDVVFFDPITRRPIDMGPFSPENVLGFELLYATPGVNDAAEIAGHLILRVKLRNNPEAARLNIDNPNDLVISFLADTESGQPAAKNMRPDAVPTECRQSWLDFGQAVREDQDAMRSILQALKGLSGGFLTVYDRQTLYQAVKTYTIDQDRNLLRFQLNLSEQQKQNLIHRLYVAKKNFKSKYYFFDRNCASILVQIIGEGIGDRDIAEFDPFVVPPNSLVALMIRKGLATQVFPSFYSYRKKGYIAQEEIRGRLPSDASKKILSAKEGDRLQAWKSVSVTHEQKLADAQVFYQLATLGQDAEMSFLDRTQRCENYTSPVTAYLRTSQRGLLERHGVKVADGAVDTNALISEKFQGEEALDARTGSQNTQLSSVSAGAVQSGGHRGYFLGYAVHRQEAGSIASQAMQRGTAVQLGDFHYESVFSEAGSEGFRWRVTGLEIRKFKERLYEVPSYFSPEGKIGLGLSLLKIRRDSTLDFTESTLGGGAVLFNLVSSRLFLDYLFVSAGADAEVVWRKSRTLKLVPMQTALVIPLRTEGLLTLGASRLWQLRGAHQERIKRISGQIFFERTSSALVQYRLPERLASEFLLAAKVERFDPFDDLSAERPQASYSLGVEWNRW